MSAIREKVLAYITRQQADRLELLVFDHVDYPEAGTQVLGGSVEPGEAPEEAVLREALEESGLSGLTISRYLGAFLWEWPERRQLQRRHVYELNAAGSLPECWIHEVSAGTEDKGLRFHYYWIDAALAASTLSGEQGRYIGERKGLDS